MSILFRQFRDLCVAIGNNASTNAKTQIIHDFITRYPLETALVIKLLLPAINKNIYNLNDKQLLKLFSRILNVNIETITHDALQSGDAELVIGFYFDKNTCIPPLDNSVLTISDVHIFLQRLASRKKEEDKLTELKRIIPKCNVNDLICILRLIKHNLKTGAGLKTVLDGLHRDAYCMFQMTNDLDTVIDKITAHNHTAQVSVMTPIQPMLAGVCTTFSQAQARCKGGIIAEFKYDGERVQIHKKDGAFKFFSRSLKPICPYKVSGMNILLDTAFPHNYSMILDAEVILMDGNDKKPLPFGSLGKHKQATFTNAAICLFIFDCLYFNDIILLHEPWIKRREIITENMVTIPQKIQLADTAHIEDDRGLIKLLNIVLSKRIEGLILKDITGTYEPGKRRWLKVKKEYIADGDMADKADLLVLGAYYGKGSNSGIVTSFLMGCYDTEKNIWCTVTKCSNGFTDKEIDAIQKTLQLKTFDKNEIPPWLSINRIHYPDFIVKDITTAPVWEITGSEFSVSQTHTAANTSIRFPRCTKIRDDKDYTTATTVAELLGLVKASKII